MAARRTTKRTKRSSGTRYEDADKRELAARMHRGETAAAISRETGISAGTLGMFKKRYPKEEFTPPGQPLALAPPFKGKVTLQLPGVTVDMSSIDGALKQIDDAAKTIAAVRESIRKVFGA